MTFESDALNFWLDFKNIEFSYTIVKYCPHFKSTFLYDWLGDKEDMSLQSTSFHCQLTPSYSNNTGYYEARSLEKEEKTHHFPLRFLFLFSLSLPVNIHFGTCLFFISIFFLSTLLAIVCSNFQFANNCRTSLVGGPEMTASASWSPFCEVWVSGPRGPLSQPLHIRNSHTSLWSLLPIFSMCMIFLCFIFAFLIILHLVNDSYFYLFIFNLVWSHLWNLSSSTRD